MSRSFRLALAAATLVIGLIPGPGRAFDAPGCGGTWTGAGRCTFRFNGGPLTLFADSVWVGHAVTVRGWISPAGSPEIPLLDCTAKAHEWATCSGELPEDGLENLPPQVMLSLQCNVSGVPGGIYHCTSGEFQ